MPSKNTKFYSVILMTADFLVLLAAFTAAYIVRVQIDSRPLLSQVYAVDYLGMALSILPMWIIVFAMLGLYNSQIYNRRLAEWGRIFFGAIIGILVVIGWQYVTDRVFFPARLVALYALGASLALVIFERELLRLIRTLAFRYGIGISRVLMIGHSGATEDIALALSATDKSGYHIVAMATPKKYVPYRKNITHYGDIATALNNITAQRIDTIIQTDFEDDDMNEKILSAAQVNHVRYNFIPGRPEFYTGKNTIDVFLGYPMISVSQTPLIGWGAIAKRIFDVLLITLFAPIWLPIFLLTLLLQKLLNPGPVYFKSPRLGRYGKVIYVYKFRSMLWKYCGPDAIKIFKDMGREDLAEEYRQNRKVAHDPRITGFGKFIRITSLDELPQLFNVLRGDMSLVGPRPIIKDEQVFYKDKASLLFSVQPGITGLWQVSGRSDLSFKERVDLELFYAQNWSFMLDLKILFKTIRVVLFGHGAR